MTPTREPWFSGKLKVHEQLKSLQYKYIMQKMSSISEEDPWIQPQLRPSVLGQYSTSIKVKPKPLKSSFFLVNSVSTITAPSWSFLCAINWFTNRLHVLFIYLFIYLFFSIRVFFHRHWGFTGQLGKGVDHFHFFLPLPPHPLTNIQTFICNFACENDYHVFLIATLVFNSMRFTTLLNYQLIDR